MTQVLLALAIHSLLASLLLFVPRHLNPKDRSNLLLLGILLIAGSFLVSVLFPTAGLANLLLSRCLEPFGLHRLPNGWYLSQNGYLLFLDKEVVAIQVMFYIWLGTSLLILNLRGYQSFLARQFTSWSLPNSDSRISEEWLKILSFDSKQLDRVTVRESQILRSPAAVGIFKATILFPQHLSEELSTKEIRAILEHEKAHIQNRDLKNTIFILVVEAIFWFQPVLSLLRREWSVCREMIADESAIDSKSLSKTAYADMLLKVLGNTQPPILQSSLGVTRDFQTLQRRLHSMKQNQPNPKIRHSVGAVGFLSVLAATVLPIAPSTTQKAKENLLTNPGFEDGIENLERSFLGNETNEVKFTLDDKVKHGGKFSLALEKSVNRFWPVQMMGETGISAKSATKRLKVSAWVKAENAKKATIAVYMNSKSSDGKIEFGTYVGSERGAVSHDWKKYEKVFECPQGTDSIDVYYQMYGPGKVWFDDVSVEFVDSKTPLSELTSDKEETKEDPEIESIKILDKSANGNAYRYIQGGFEQPAEGFKLAIFLPGGDGSAEFSPFIRRVYFAMGEEKGFVYAQGLAPKGSGSENLVWPLARNQREGTKFITENYIRDIIADVKKQTKIDPKHIYLVGWSSGGPASYASLLRNKEVTGAFVGMSVYRPNQLDSLLLSKGKKLYLFQSPEDKVTKFAFAEQAEKEFKAAGAEVKLVTYPGGHGFASGDPFGDLAKAFQWLTGEK
jgi:beta-lactamase regulating signal transducer with metallopeptidase domain/predicted esterase